jgi:D-glycero-D-manno-heptose 1,7-bisphosphate phosphatase
MEPPRRAVFLDRDGVLNPLVFHADRLEHDSPLMADQLDVFAHAVEPLQRLHAAGYLLVVVTNQPAAAKGKTTAEALAGVREAFEAQFRALGLEFDGYQDCPHHPRSTQPALRTACDCRKPNPGLLLAAARRLGIDLRQSWMVGDRDTDVWAGQKAGCRTILIEGVEKDHHGQSDPDGRCRDIREACAAILEGVWS